MAHAATDAERIARIRAGDRDAFVALYDDELPALWRLATQRCAGRVGAEALVRATLVHAFRHLAEYPARIRFTDWLRAIAEDLASRPDPADRSRSLDSFGR